MGTQLSPGTQSGLGVLISGQVVSVSGQSVALASGTVSFGQSGLHVTAYVSGQTAQMISGQALYVQMSGVTNELSGLNVVVQSGLGVVGSFSASVSGQPVALVSGTLVVSQSGLNVIVQSGLGVVGSFSASVSGQPVALTSGTIVVGQSGISVIFRSGTNMSVEALPSTGVRTRAILACTTNSAGTQLVSGVVHSVTIKALSGAMYVGGAAGVDMPYSGYGMLLAGGEAITIDVGNFNQVRVCAATNNDPISYIGIV